MHVYTTAQDTNNPVPLDTYTADDFLEAFSRTDITTGNCLVHMFTHRDFCQRVLDSGGHYLLIAKGNQGNLERDLRSFFADDPELSPLPTAAAC